MNQKRDDMRASVSPTVQAPRDSGTYDIRSTLRTITLLCEPNGEPVDGYRFRELVIKARAFLAEPEATAPGTMLEVVRTAAREAGVLTFHGGELFFGRSAGESAESVIGVMACLLEAALPDRAPADELRAALQDERVRHAATAHKLMNANERIAVLEGSKPNPHTRGEAIRKRVPPEIGAEHFTPREALEFYAAGKHFDVVDSHDRRLTRIRDTGGIAEMALLGMDTRPADDPAAPSLVVKYERRILHDGKAVTDWYDEPAACVRTDIAIPTVQVRALGVVPMVLPDEDLSA